MASKFNSVVTLFSAKFVNQLEKDKSVVSSPLSAQFLLALLTLGSSGEGHQELLSALGLADDDEIRQVFSNVAKKLKAVGGVTLKVANKVYVAEGDYNFQKKLKQDAAKVFDAATFQKVNFNNSVAVANLINTWVEKQTNNKIKDLLSPDDFKNKSVLVLVNAIYFKGTWTKKFNSKYTRDERFYSPGKKTKVPMMSIADKYRYMESEGLNAQVLELPYVGNEASMVIVLPAEVDGLDGVLAKLADGYDLMADLQRMNSTKVQVSIPKFKIETHIDLNSLLRKIGITKIFSAQDSGLTKVLNTNYGLFVSKAVQKAFIEVNEEGAEAAAATAFGLVKLSRRNSRPPKYFCANRPFLFLIMVEKKKKICGFYNKNVLPKTPLFWSTFRGY